MSRALHQKCFLYCFNPLVKISFILGCRSEFGQFGQYWNHQCWLQRATRFWIGAIQIWSGNVRSWLQAGTEHQIESAEWKKQEHQISKYFAPNTDIIPQRNKVRLGWQREYQKWPVRRATWFKGRGSTEVR